MIMLTWRRPLDFTYRWDHRFLVNALKYPACCHYQFTIPLNIEYVNLKGPYSSGL